MSEARTVRMEWGVPLGWAASYPQWPDKVRAFVREARAAGLTQIIVREDRITLLSGAVKDIGVDIIALPPGVAWRDEA